jgi:hypothetical protein
LLRSGLFYCPSVSSGELNGYLSGYGRFFSFGDGPSVGLGGFLLQGGMGLGFRGWGYAAEQIAAIDVVTAAERSRDSTFRTRPVPKGLLSTTQIYPLERYAEVLEWLWEIHPSVSPDVALAVVSVIPPFPVPGGN